MPGSLTQIEAIARSGIVTHRNAVDTISHNVANANTHGFKRVRAGFAETLESQGAPEGEVLAGIVTNDTSRLFTQGALEESEYPWHLAITGDGFFAISLPGGQTAYTRDGNFRIDAQGTLVTAAGYRLQANVRIPPGLAGISFEPNGAVVGLTPAGDTVTIGTIPLVRFTNANGLTVIGDNMYQASDASGTPITGVPGAAGMGEIRQGALERSNVDMAEEMVNLMLAQRAYSLSTRAMAQADELWNMSNNLRR
ncbi:MAG: flagellar hook basal-body protein [Chloroflexi bacterium]|nr:flagellar hook basal-body protein [Chloroflexota bacterium]